MSTMLPAAALRGQIIFSHGNSFVASTYRTMLAALADQGWHIDAIDKFGHDPRYPVTDNWEHLVSELANFCQRHAAPAQCPRYLLGHSMGGILSLMAAARYPGLAQGVVLLDAPLLGGWRAQLVRLAKHLPWLHKYSPGAVSRRRRNEWPDRQAAEAHFASKALFARWHPQALTDYILTGMRPSPRSGEPHRQTLAFDRDVETRIYYTLPDNTSRWLRKHHLQCPVAYIGGSQSREMRQVGLQLTRALTQGRIQILEGGSHLFPMEMPEDAAQAVCRAIDSLGAAA